MQMLNVMACYAMVRKQIQKVVQLWVWAIAWKGLGKGCARIKCTNDIPCHAMPCHVMSFHVTSCHVMSCYSQESCSQSWATVGMSNCLALNKILLYECREWRVEEKDFRTFLAYKGLDVKNVMF